MGNVKPVSGKIIKDKIKIAIFSDLHLERSENRKNTEVCFVFHCQKCSKDFPVLKKDIFKINKCFCKENSVTVKNLQINKPIEWDFSSKTIYFKYSTITNNFGAYVEDNDIDLVICAGDIHNGVNSSRYLLNEFKNTPVIFVPGNHEYYSSMIMLERKDILKSMRKELENSNIFLLDRDIKELNIKGLKLQVLGTTLWTDYKVNENLGISQKDGMQIAENSLNDHNYIYEKSYNNNIKMFSAQDALKEHKKSREFLDKNLKKSLIDKKPTIVVTHHPAIPFALNPKIVGNGKALDVAFASDLTDILNDGQPELVIWGHTHYSYHQKKGDIEFLSKQKGYEYENLEKNWYPQIIEFVPNYDKGLDLLPDYRLSK
jgi:predicted phosphodiesterase